jgi:xylan 1,4-beta-xylosidase
VGDELWVVYTIVRTMGASAKDLDNYLVTARSLDGPWSEPVRLGARGFDPSLFHDDDGRHWLACVQWDPRPGREPFAGIAVQEYDHAERRLVGKARVVLRADEVIEGPNLHRRDGRVYLMVAQGGTGWNHGVAMARASDVLGPYEWDPRHSVLTSRGAPELRLQKAGHGELVRTPDDAWYLVHLAARPVSDGAQRFCVTGRETCLQRVTWDADGWLRLADDEGLPLARTGPRERVLSTCASPTGTGNVASDEVPAAARADDLIEEFDAPELDLTRWSSLRRPVTPDWADVQERPGWLRFHRGQSPASRFTQSLVGTRLQESCAVVTATVDTSPAGPLQRAGLCLWSNAVGYWYIHVTIDDDGRRVVGVESASPEAVARVGRLHAIDTGPTHLRFRLDGPRVDLEFSGDGDCWTSVGGGSTLAVSDDYPGRLRFTGAFAALRADDHDGVGFVADVDRVVVSYPA